MGDVNSYQIPNSPPAPSPDFTGYIVHERLPGDVWEVRAYNMDSVLESTWRKHRLTGQWVQVADGPTLAQRVAATIQHAVDFTPYWTPDPSTHQCPYENAARALALAGLLREEPPTT